MSKAQTRDAIRKQKFYFRNSLSVPVSDSSFGCLYSSVLLKKINKSYLSSPLEPTEQENNCEFRLMTIDEIINGSVCLTVF